MAVNDSTGVTPTPAMPVGITPINYATTLPTSPFDGQETVLVDSITNPTYQWRFRYNAGSSSAYKWELIGGVPWRGSGGSANVPVAAPITDITGGPTFTNPRPGVYRIHWGASVYNGGTFAGAYQSQITLYVGSTSTGIYAELRHHSAVYDGAQIMMSAEPTLTSALLINLKAAMDRTGSNTTVTNVWMEVLPVRVS